MLSQKRGLDLGLELDALLVQLLYCSFAGPRPGHQVRSVHPVLILVFY